MTRINVRLKAILLSSFVLILFATPINAANFQISSIDETKRLYGDDRYQTAQVIAKQINNGTVDCVVLAPGSTFVNALPASVLAHKNNAPLLLVNRTSESTREAFDYINNHLSKTGKIYLVGDRRLIGYDFITELNNLGYTNVTRVSGDNKYETDYLIAQELNISNKTPVVISSGEKFPDALSVSSFASANGWPILLSDGKVLTSSIRNFIAEKQPSTIYITGGEGAISKSLEDSLKNIAPNAKITRFAGNDRYETAMLIANHFASSPPNIYIASDYLDALAGSVLAAKTKSPIILVDPTTKRYLPKEIVSFMVAARNNQEDTNVIGLGGPVALPDDVFTLAAELAGQFSLTSIGQPVDVSYAFEKESWWHFSKAFVEHEGELSIEQELAVQTAVKFSNEWLTVDYRTVDESDFGLKYATYRFAQEERKRITDSRNTFTRQSFVNRVEKLTVTGIGTFYMLQDTPYTYVKIRSDAVAYNSESGGSIKRTDNHIICLYNIHGYWQVDLVQ